MILYYTGTGNSKAAADILLSDGEKLISMTEAKWNNEFTYSLAEGEKVGFVFPVYYYGLPATVLEFAKKVRFENKPAYTYTVITCGGSIAGAGGLLQKALASNGTSLDAVYEVKMPDNYVILYDVTTETEEKPILEAAENKLAQIKEKVALNAKDGMPVSAGAKLQTGMLYKLYNVCRNTKKFYTIDTCVSCGVCVSRCPAKAIELIDGKPTWVKNKCDHCMSCIRCNAIQYGKKTEGKYRYKHPSLRKSCH